MFDFGSTLKKTSSSSTPKKRFSVGNSQQQHQQQAMSREKVIHKEEEEYKTNVMTACHDRSIVNGTNVESIKSQLVMRYDKLN
ncbi:hypothetical protein BLOT_010039 [Blomia tropicalis]|nr:hypothetical protein BLOT_010039 [Blomia tropicalis]